MTDSQNLILALISGITYIIGAQLSHRLEKKISHKKAMLIFLLLQFLTPFLSAFYHSFIQLNVLFSVFAFANGMTWPFAESYASAGLDRKTASSSIGIYNICWSTAIPLALFLSGWLIAKTETYFFFFVCGGVSLSFIPVLFLPMNIPHKKTINEFNNNNEENIDGIEKLVFSSRCSMFFSYCIIQLLNSLLPGKFYSLNISLGIAGIAAGLIDVSRIIGFIFMSRTHYWHGNKLSLILASPALAIGFFICMFATKLSIIVVGEILIGLFAAISYYAALFYAMHMKKASVNAGAIHESIIGLGFVLGPIVGIISEKLILIPAFSIFRSSTLTILLLGMSCIPASIFSLLKKEKTP